MEDDIDDPAAGGSFVTGGYRRAPRRDELPDIAAVRRVTVYQDQDGQLWKATHTAWNRPRWMPAAVVTANEDRAAKRATWLWLLAAAACMGLVGIACAVGSYSLLLAIPSMVGAGFAIWRSQRRARDVEAHLVAPDFEDL